MIFAGLSVTGVAMGVSPHLNSPGSSTTVEPDEHPNNVKEADEGTSEDSP